MAKKLKTKKVTYTDISPDVQRMDYLTTKSKMRGDKFVQKSTQAVGFTNFKNGTLDGQGTRTKTITDKNGKVIKKKVRTFGSYKVAKLI